MFGLMRRLVVFSSLVQVMVEEKGEAECLMAGWWFVFRLKARNSWVA